MIRFMMVLCLVATAVNSARGEYTQADADAAKANMMTARDRMHVAGPAFRDAMIELNESITICTFDCMQINLWTGNFHGQAMMTVVYASWSDATTMEDAGDGFEIDAIDKWNNAILFYGIDWDTSTVAYQEAALSYGLASYSYEQGLLAIHDAEEYLTEVEWWVIANTQ